jgi:hypothetical protein
MSHSDMGTRFGGIILPIAVAAAELPGMQFERCEVDVLPLERQQLAHPQSTRRIQEPS